MKNLPSIVSKSGLIILSVFILDGCTMASRTLDKVPVVTRLVGDDGYLRDRSGVYLEAETIERTQIPGDMDSYIIDDLYVIPEVNAPLLSETGEVPRPRPIQGKTEREIVMQSINGVRWIIAGTSPSQLWPRVKDYFLVNSIPLVYENPTRGVMDTAWFVMEEERPSQEKLRISIEPGFQDSSSEVRVTHMSTTLALPAIDQINWPEDSIDQDLSNSIVEDMSYYLAEISDIYQVQAVSFLAGNISSVGRASLQTLATGETQLRLRADYDRSWAAIGLALTRTPGVEVLNRSKDDGTVELRYQIIDEDEDEPGLMGRVFTFDHFRADDPVYTMTLQLLPSGDTVFVEAVESRVEGKEKEEQDTAKSLLELIRRVIA